MKSITIHGIDEKLEELILAKAENEGMNLNETIKKILYESLGFKPECESDRRKDFLDLFGVWTESDVLEFENAVKDFETISSEDWR